ncbi:hypothetical protein AURDEDRAFT_167835 [Auricularia subglabra TFB-10046 SS5]|nr:hypothetical protein AURDEDRAFT_167835 [Auricularia subglabra TFB-10046 SS5]
MARERVTTSFLLSQVTAFAVRPHEPGPDLDPHVLATGLPPPPQLFFGREVERRSVSGQLLRSSHAHVAVLGGPGMGKTSLALSIMHDPLIATRFGRNRFFISCESAVNLGAVISGAFGFTTTSPDGLRTALRGRVRDVAALMVLDNFESVWEPAATRSEAEHILLLLSGLPNLSIILTMRGAERPNGVEWTRPFLPILRPLDNPAAATTFLSICDPRAPQDALEHLLSGLDNIPLAVVLMANLAQSEPMSSLLARWNEVKTSILTRNGGNHRLNSLDVSLTLSLESPRMMHTPAAAQLLSLLALLPRGAMAADIEIWSSSIPPDALVTLLRNALVTQTGRRLYVLAPVREFVLQRHPPPPALARPLYEYYFAWACAIGKPFRSVVAGAMALVADDIENIEAVIRYALVHCDDVEPALAAAVSVCSLYSHTGIRFPTLLCEAMSVARRDNLHGTMADLSYWWAIACWNISSAGDASQMMEDARRFYELAGNAVGVADASMQLLTSLEPEDAVREGMGILTSVEALGDTRRIARCCREIALAHERGGQLRTARVFYARAVSALRDGGEAEGYLYGFLLTQEAVCDTYLCALPNAVALLEEAIRTLTEEGAVPHLAEAEYCLGVTRLAQCDGRTAVVHLRRAVELNQTAQWSWGCAFAYNLAVACLSSGDEDGAIAAVEAAEKELRSSTEQHSPPGRCWLLSARGEIALWRGDLAEAHALLLAARIMLQNMRIGPRIDNAMTVPEELMGNEAGVLDSLAKVYLEQERHSDAFEASLVASLIWAKLGRSINAVRSLTQLADAASDDLAGTLLSSTIPVLRQCGIRSSLAHALLRLAAISEQSKDRESLGWFVMEASTIFDALSDISGSKKAAELSRAFWTIESANDE